MIICGYVMIESYWEYLIYPFILVHIFEIDKLKECHGY